MFRLSDVIVLLFNGEIVQILLLGTTSSEQYLKYGTFALIKPRDIFGK